VIHQFIPTTIANENKSHYYLFRQQHVLRNPTPTMSEKHAGKATPRPPQPRCIHSHELFGDQNRVRIMHEGVEYQLQITRHGKLILTK
jgi:hemin uptake protein HemP